MERHYLSSGGRYPVLRALAILYLIGAAVACIAGLIAAIWALVDAPGGAGDRIVLALGALAATFFVVVTMLAIAEVLKLFIDIEHNTRMAILTAGRSPAAAAPGDAKTADRLATHSAEEETAEAALLRGH